MKKYLLVFLVILITLNGCSNLKKKSSDSSFEAYQSYYEAIEENSRFLDESLYFTLDGKMSKMPDGTYRYYVFLDNPQIAMYNIKFMAVENNVPYTDSTKMMPSIGIFEDQDYSLIPYQANTPNGYVKGLVISGESTQSEIQLKILVEWTDKTHEKFNREYFNYVLSEHSFHTPSSNLISQGEKNG